MITERTLRKRLKTELNKKLYFAEILEKLIKVTYCLADDKLYTADDAIPELIKIIHLLEQEQQAIMKEIQRIEKQSN
ncbi:hypothetical protein [Oceanobacillus oncorhynchi]|uniref:hypothetical protein n=1 Tax=Oceanobacillus oncorhynchi TaxID=545501 RepID=UPI001865C66C|nr:hypothetical protein [Oceanobacillus oncorhynchi]